MALVSYLALSTCRPFFGFPCHLIQLPNNPLGGQYYPLNIQENTEPQRS